MHLRYGKYVVDYKNNRLVHRREYRNAVDTLKRFARQKLTFNDLHQLLTDLAEVSQEGVLNNKHICAEPEVFLSQCWGSALSGAFTDLKFRLLGGDADAACGPSGPHNVPGRDNQGLSRPAGNPESPGAPVLRLAGGRSC